MAAPTDTPITIRLATLSDIPRIQALESASGTLFRQVGMEAICDLFPPPSLDSYAEYLQQKHLWVAISTLMSKAEVGREAKETIVAFVQVEIFANDGILKTVYIHQVSVDPQYSRKGIGKQMLDFVALWAREEGARALDLTTFNDVPWNRRYYERLGFTVLADDRLIGKNAEDVRRELDKEMENEVLGRWKRVAMRKLLYSE